MKAVLMSIKPKWCEKIFSGEKTVEVRKTAPKLEPPFKVYVYCTKQGRPLVWGAPCAYYADERLTQTFGYSFEEADKIFGALNGKVVGEFLCDKIEESIPEYDPYTKKCINYYFVIGNDYLTSDGFREYINGKPLYGLHIAKPKRYDTPKELSEFKKIQSCSRCKNQYTYHCIFHCNGKEKLTRPPQDWMYVEEIEE